MLRRLVLALIPSVLLAIPFIPGNPNPCAARRGNYVVINPHPHPEKNTFTIRGPALIGFFPTVTQEQMDDPYADGLDTLAYLLLALQHVSGCLGAIDPEVRIVLNDQLTFHWDGAATSVKLSEKPGRKCGAYLLKPESGWRVVYSVADPDSFERVISEAAADYFGVPECSSEFVRWRRGMESDRIVCDGPPTHKVPSIEFMPRESVQRMWNDFPYDAITLERNRCSGWCPAYRVTFHRGGRAEWCGFLSSKRNGAFAGEVWITDYAKLCYLLKRMSFDHLPPEYLPGETGTSACIVTAISRTNIKVVSDYGHAGPRELSSIEQAIDAVAETIAWKER